MFYLFINIIFVVHFEFWICFVCLGLFNYPVCGMTFIRKSSPCSGSSRFPLSIWVVVYHMSEWRNECLTTPQLKITLNIHSFIHHISDAITVNKNVLRVSLNKTFPSSFLPWAVQHFRQLYINEIRVYQWVMLIVMCGTFSKAVKQCHTFFFFFFFFF